MSFAKEKKSTMEKKTEDGKMKSVASIPDNYVSILQLQERWMKEKEQKHKETHLEVKQQQVNGQRRREEEPRVKLEGKSLGLGFHTNPRKKEPNCVEKEEAEEVSAVVSKKKEEDGENSSKRKKKWSKKKKQGGSVKEVFKSGSKAYIPVKEETQVEKTVQNRENAAACNSIAVETQFQHLQIKKRVEEYRQVKVPAKLNSHYRNQKHETRTMVWVKKGGENNGS